ncbi:MAG: nuclear transport factor 2 family protein [Clostridia bacterium]|nr:nuclear transport factor 2 family protein [Clostridia bacterium]
MAKVTIGEDCGNSSKKTFLKQLNIAFAENDTAFIINSVSEDISWNIIGDKHIQGKKDFVEALEQMKNYIMNELTISSIITHGREGAVNGLIKMEDGRKYAFCDVYEFSGAKGSCVKSMISYVIEVEE